MMTRFRRWLSDVWDFMTGYWGPVFVLPLINAPLIVLIAVKGGFDEVMALVAAILLIFIGVYNRDKGRWWWPLLVALGMGVPLFELAWSLVIG